MFRKFLLPSHRSCNLLVLCLFKSIHISIIISWDNRHQITNTMDTLLCICSNLGTKWTTWVIAFRSILCHLCLLTFLNKLSSKDLHFILKQSTIIMHCRSNSNSNNISLHRYRCSHLNNSNLSKLLLRLLLRWRLRMRHRKRWLRGSCRIDISNNKCFLCSKYSNKWCSLLHNSSKWLWISQRQCNNSKCKYSQASSRCNNSKCRYSQASSSRCSRLCHHLCSLSLRSRCIIPWCQCLITR
jgi:hypothetical protein